MEELGWERNMFNINHHHQQKTQESIIFGSENIFLNPIQDLTKTGSNPITTTTDGQIGSHHSDSASQYWYQTLASVNCLHKGTSVIPHTSLEWPDCLRHISSDDSETKEIDDGIASQNSPEKNPNSNSGYYEPNRRRSKRSRSDLIRSTSPTINFRQSTSESDETDSEVIAQMKEMIYRAASFRPVSFADGDPVEKRRRKNVRISNDPQTVAARKRRERVSERIRVLQKLVPGGNKMDTASMLDEAANYLKFLRSQVKALEQFGQKLDYVSCGTTTNAYSTTQNIQIFNDNVTLGVPLPMQTRILQPHQQIVYLDHS